MVIIVFACVQLVIMVFMSHLQIAAISPADVNYEETLSTLRFGRFSQSISLGTTHDHTAYSHLTNNFLKISIMIQTPLDHAFQCH